MTKLASVVGLLCFCNFVQPTSAQSSLVLSPVNVLSGSPGSLTLSLSSPAGSEPAALQWTFTYPSVVTGFSVSAGPALAAAGKSITCAGDASAYTCLATGLNSNIIANGVVGTVSFSSPGVSSVSVAIPNAVAASPTGSSVAVSASGAAFTEVSISGLQCVAATSGYTCTVTLSAAAPAGGTIVQISSANPALSVPASVTIPGAATSASFVATASPVTTAQTAQITASLGASGASAILSLSPSYSPLLQIQGTASEISGVGHHSTVTPAISPAGFTGSVIVNGNGSVNFTSGQAGNGVYFLNCCTNNHNAYYKFTGAAIGNVFNTQQGQISFHLQSRYSFAQRQASAGSARYTFDVRDGNGSHLFYFLTQVSSASLEFSYMAGGSGQSYTVPKGTEDALFGSGVTLNVTLGWGSSGLNLYLNGAVVKSTTYAASAANWTAASNFDLGAYEHLSSGGQNVSDDAIGVFSVNAPAAGNSVNVPAAGNLPAAGSLPLLQLHADATEVSATTNGALVTPSIGPPGFTGTVVANGGGSVNFEPGQTGNGVYFLNCCTNFNNAYYKFTGAALGSIFNTSQGEITFYLKSRYSFAQRKANAWTFRYAFDVRDGNGSHLFGFLTQVASGSLVFTYGAAGSGTDYYVPAGTEDALFGNGVLLQVTISWSSAGVNLYLNNTLAQSAPYVAPSPSWTAASIFDLGAYEYFTFGGYNGSDDVIDEFTVTGVPHQ